jgi:hypothetical protein
MYPFVWFRITCVDCAPASTPSSPDPNITTNNMAKNAVTADREEILRVIRIARIATAPG